MAGSDKTSSHDDTMAANTRQWTECSVLCFGLILFAEGFVIAWLIWGFHHG